MQGFYVEWRTRVAVLTDVVLIQMQQRLDDGITVKDIAAEQTLQQ